MLTLAVRLTPLKAAIAILEPRCEFSLELSSSLTWLTVPRHCVDAEQTYDVSLALEAEAEDEDAHAHEETHDHAAEPTTETTTHTDHEITEVTDCHAHTDTLYCMAGSEEWQVTTEVDVANPPDGYSGCHAHGEDELYAL